MFDRWAHQISTELDRRQPRRQPRTQLTKPVGRTALEDDMSVASDFPPIVHIPERARTTLPPSRASRAVRAAHLSVVPQRTGSQSIGLLPAAPRAWTGRVPQTGRVRRVKLDERLGIAFSPANQATLAAAPLRLTRRGL